MPYSPTMIANNILSRSFAEKNYMTPMKLQKILYFTASEYQKLTGNPLLEETFRTWDYGPVLYSVYNEFRGFSKQDITCYARDARGDVFTMNESQDPALKIALDRVWTRAKHFTAVQLSEITHAEDSAWYRAYQNEQPELDSTDIESDATYAPQLGLAPYPAAP